MLLKLILAFTLLPIAEIYLLIKLGGFIGAFNTILIVIATAILGGYLAKSESTRTFAQIRLNLDQGKVPTEDLLDALLIFIAGAILLTPGFITDIAGLLLLIPTSRKYIKSMLRQKFEHKIQRDYIDITPS
ncbi:MAG: FxsA family protein [Thermodesulfobacteriota bacterium]